MQLDARVIRSGEAAAAQAAGRHVEVAAVLLHHHVARDLRRAEQRMLRLIDREGLGNALRERRIGVVPARLEFCQRNAVRRVAVDLVRRHVDERRLRAGPPRRFEQVQRADGVGVEIVERNRRRAIVARLRGGVHDDVRPQARDQRDARRRDRECRARDGVKPVSSRCEALLVPARVALLGRRTRRAGCCRRRGRRSPARARSRRTLPIRSGPMIR